MRSGGSKAKGSAFERRVCKDLSLWISKGKRSDCFWRSAMSGGRSTVAMKKGGKLGSQAGDVSSIDALGHAFIEQFYIECKAYKKLDLDCLIKGTGHLLNFWELAVADAEQYDKSPLLIGKQNNHPIIVCLSKHGRRAFRIDTSMVRMTVNHCGMTIIWYDDFLRINPKIIRT